MKRNKKTKQSTKHNTNIKPKAVQKTQTPALGFEKFLNVWTLLALIFIIGFLALSKYLTGEYLFFFKDIGSDSINQNYPAIVHYTNLLQESFLSKWSFYKGMGDEYITGIPSEPYGLIRLALNYLGAENIGVNYFVYGRFIQIFIYNFLFSGVIAFFYFRTLSFKKLSSLTAALFISFSGYMIVGAGWGFSSHVFKAIFLLFAFEQLYLKNRWYFFPFAVIYLSGNPFVLFIYSVFLLLYSLFRFFAEKENNVKDYLILAGKMILLGTLGVLMNFVHLFKAFEKMFSSPRVAGSASYSNLLSAGQNITDHANLGATTLLRFFSSDLLGTGSNFMGWQNYLEAPLFYIGLLTLLMFPQVFIYLDKRRKLFLGVLPVFGF